MPYSYNFTNLKFVKEVVVNPVGWVSNLVIEYGIGGYPEDSYYWRIKDTYHTFVIPAKRLNYITLGNYDKHFEEVLQSFREDYISWSEQGFELDWQREYFNQYHRFIVI